MERSLDMSKSERARSIEAPSAPGLGARLPLAGALLITGRERLSWRRGGRRTGCARSAAPRRASDGACDRLKASADTAASALKQRRVIITMYLQQHWTIG